jgi:hypothetical protein
VSEIGQFLPLVSVIHYEMSQSQGTEADTCEPTHTFKDAIFIPGKDAIFIPGEEVTNIIPLPSLPPPCARARHVG